MTVNVEDPYSSATVIEGVDDYNFDFTIQENTDLVVHNTVEGEIPILLVLDSDYSITLNEIAPNPGWGYITLLTSWPIGSLLEMTRAVPADQTVAWSNYGDLPMDLIEDSFDKTALIDQQLQDEVDRALKAAPGSAGDYTLPAAEANKVIGIWDETATTILIGPTADEISNAQGYATAAAASASLAQEWAEKPEDMPVVDPDQYSALHWAAKAAESAEGLPQAADPWNWTAIQSYPPVALTINAGVVDWNGVIAPSATLALGENVVLNALTLPESGDYTNNDTTMVKLTVVNAGSFTITFDGSYIGGANPIPQPAFNGRTVYVFQWDKANQQALYFAAFKEF